MKYYTLWKSNKNNMDEATLLTDEPLFFTKKFSIKRALEIVNGFNEDSNDVILVRQVSMNSQMCKQWVVSLQ